MKMFKEICGSLLCKLKSCNGQIVDYDFGIDEITRVVRETTDLESIEIIQ